MKHPACLARTGAAISALLCLTPVLRGQYAEPATVVVRTDPDARLDVEGVTTLQTGDVRHFVTPPLPVDQDSTYRFRATWKEPGQECSADRKVILRGGQKVEVDLRTPDGHANRPVLGLDLPAAVVVEPGGKMAVALRVRRYRFNGPVTVAVEGSLPEGVAVPTVTIPAGQTEGRLEATITTGTQYADAQARVVGTAGQARGEAAVRVIVTDAPRLAETYLLSGQLAEGEAALTARLKAFPKDDRARFGLGAVQFVHGVERLGQALYRYGVRSENANVPILRLPVPKNPAPAPIDDAAFRRLLGDFYRDLSTAEATLAGVIDDAVKLPLRLAAVRLDLDGDGKATDRLTDIMKQIMQRQRFDFLDGNPDFLVCFDRGDVAWLRAYCHLLMGILDLYLAMDTEPWFDAGAAQLFEKPTIRRRDQEPGKEFQFAEPARLGQLRRHWIKVAELNRETWRYIRAETDDDHEWLPNPKQKGVLGLPVRDEMIDAWLAMMSELEALLDGKRTLPKDWNSYGRNGKGLNLKILLDDPPKKWTNLPNDISDKYFTEGKDVDLGLLIQVAMVFQNTTSMASPWVYPAWFN
jgi:uncharacterized protein (TIGR03000 family)